MDSVRLGTLGPTVTRVVAAAAIPPVPLGRGVPVLVDAWDLGVRALDVRDATAERDTVAGRFLEERQPEDVAVLAGVGAPSTPDRGADLSAERIARDVAAAARRLGRVDAAWTRRADARTPLEETLTALAAALEGGLLRSWGASGVDAWGLEALLVAADRGGLPRPGFVRVRLNLLARGAERDVLPLAAGERLGVLGRDALAGERLTDRHVAAEEATERAVAGGAAREDDADPALGGLLRLRDLARERGLAVEALATAWSLAHPALSATIVPADSPADLDVVHAAVEEPLDEEWWERVGDALR